MSQEATGQAPQPPRLLKHFDIFVGEWMMVGTHPLLPGEIEGGSTFEWLREGGLLVWHFNWERGKQIPNAYSIIGHDDTVEYCTMLYTDERGVARIYNMTLEGKIWKMWRDTPDFSQRMTGTFSDDGNTITVKGEMSKDGITWEGDLSIIYTRRL